LKSFYKQGNPGCPAPHPVDFLNPFAVDFFKIY